MYTFITPKGRFEALLGTTFLQSKTSQFFQFGYGYNSDLAMHSFGAASN